MAIGKLATLAAALVVCAGAVAAQDQPMGFFVTSKSMGNGGDLGGLEGADAYCTSLAEAAGTTGRTWRAYLSTQEEGKRGVSARYRIGTGPWYNAKGELIVEARAFRTQSRNRQAAREKLADIIRVGLKNPPKRIRKLPSARAKQKRIDNKKKRGKIKSNRRKILPGSFD